MSGEVRILIVNTSGDEVVVMFGFLGGGVGLEVGVHG